MKKYFSVLSGLIVLVSCIIACTNVIDEDNIKNIGYDLKIEAAKSGMINDFLSTKFTIDPADDKLENKYSFKYVIIEGGGKFINEDNVEFIENEEINITGVSLNLRYIPAKDGVNKIKIIINSNFEIQKEEIIEFKIDRLDIIWEVLSTVTKSKPGEKVPLKITLKSDSLDDLAFTRKYSFTQGKGKLLDDKEKEIDQDKLIPIKEGEYLIDVLVEEEGIVKLKFDLNYGEGKMISKTISFEVDKKALNTSAIITKFSINEVEGIIGDDNNISILLPEETDLTKLIPIVEISNKATVTPLSGKIQDFSKPIKYIVTAEDGITKSEYSVIATVKAIPVKSITLETTNKELFVNDMFQLVASIKPDNATNKSIVWSSDSSSATVDVKGKVTAKAAGQAIITAKTVDGDLVATATITVKLPLSTEAKLSNFKIGNTVGVFTGNTINVILPSVGGGVAALSPTFEISSKATVNVKSGVARDFSKSVEYIVTAEDGITKTTYTVIVKIKVKGIGITFPMRPVLNEGKSTSLVYKIDPLDATNQSVTFKSDNINIATVSTNGQITAKSAGNAEITVTTADGGFTDRITVTVLAIVPVTGISGLPLSRTIQKGKTSTLIANILPADATNKNVIWKSSNTAVATVNSNGVVTAVNRGKATITATTEDGNFKDTSSITVQLTNLDSSTGKYTAPPGTECEIKAIGNGRFFFTVTVTVFRNATSGTIKLGTFSNSLTGGDLNGLPIKFTMPSNGVVYLRSSDNVPSTNNSGYGGSVGITHLNSMEEKTLLGSGGTGNGVFKFPK